MFKRKERCKEMTIVLDLICRPLRINDQEKGFWESICSLKLVLLFFMLLLIASHSVSAFTLEERAPEGKWFETVEVTWTHDGDPIPITTKVGGVTSVIFDTNDEEAWRNLEKGYINDWKQYRKLNDGTESTVEGVFAKAGSPYNFLGYEDAYSLLGLGEDDFIYLPDFSADIDGDNLADTHLYSAVNLYELALSHTQFINNQPFQFGQSYEASEFMAYGFVFSLTDNIQFDSSLGYVTATPLQSSTSIIADSEHITGIPEPTTICLLGLGGLALRRRRRA